MYKKIKNHFTLQALGILLEDKKTDKGNITDTDFAKSYTSRMSSIE